LATDGGVGSPHYSTVNSNGVRGNLFKHRKGLREGEPLSPMLFTIAMEPLHLMLKKANDQQLLSPIVKQGCQLED